MRHARASLAALLLLGACLVGLLLARPWAPSPNPGPPVDPGPAPGGAGPSSRPSLPAEELVPEPLAPGLLRRAAAPGTEGWIAFPDGSALPPLNGVPALNKPLNWPEGHPFTPVKGKVRLGDGREWYLHENGMHSTTLFWDVEDGQGRSRREAIGLVRSPEAPLPRTATGR